MPAPKSYSDEEMATFEARQPKSYSEEEMKAHEAKQTESLIYPEPEKSLPRKIWEGAKALPGQAIEAGKQALEIPAEIAASPSKAFEPQGRAGALLRGQGQGFSYGAVPKMAGVVGAIDELGARMSPFESRSIEQTRPSQSTWEALKGRYEEERNAREHENDISAGARPELYGAGNVAAAAASPNPFSKLGALAKGAGITSKAINVGGRIVGSAGQGELYAAGSSNAPTLSEYFEDIAKGGLTGAVVGGVAEGLGGLGAATKAIKSNAIENNAARLSNVAAKDYASSRGLFGSTAKEPLAKYKSIESEIESGAATPEQIAEYKSFGESELGKRTRQRAISNNIKSLSGDENQMIEAEAAMNAAKEAASPEAIASANKIDLGRSVIATEIAPRLDRLYGGAGFSMASEYLPFIKGAPKTTLKNLYNTPLVQLRAGQIGGAVAEPLAAAANVAEQPIARGLINESINEDNKSFPSVMEQAGMSKRKSKLGEYFNGQ